MSVNILGLSGSAIADVSALGSVEIPMMIQAVDDPVGAPDV